MEKEELAKYIGIMIGIIILLIGIIIYLIVTQTNQVNELRCEDINWNNILNAYQSIGGYILLKGDDSDYYNQTRKNYQEIYYILSDYYIKCIKEGEKNE